MKDIKTVLGLDLGTNSIGWALVKENSTDLKYNEIIKLGVRVIQYDTFNKIDKLGKVSESKNPIEDFISGKGLSPNAKRTQQRGARRNLQRFKLRRKELIKLLLENKILTENSLLSENGAKTTFQTLALRAKAVTTKIELEEFARVLLSINKKRGYKSSRKANNAEEVGLIDGMSVAKELYDNQITPGQYVLKLIEQNIKYVPEFYQSDLKDEFALIWKNQSTFYPEIFTSELFEKLQNKNKNQTWSICKEAFKIEGEKRIKKGADLKLENYTWRNEALNIMLSLEQLSNIFQEINNQINRSSGYLGAISDRSKSLYFNKETIGQNLLKQVNTNPNISLKKQIFYRQDYLNEFEAIWETQSKFHKVLTNELKIHFRDVIIFYQRRLKSQKHLIAHCEFEKQHKAIPKSSPLFQEFKIWQILNILEFKNKKTKAVYDLSLDDKKRLFDELSIRGTLNSDAILKFFNLDKNEWNTNFKNGVEGNNTNAALFNVYQEILKNEGYGFDWNKKNANEIIEELKIIFSNLGIDEKILSFDSGLLNDNFDKQESYQFWHLLYSFEDEKQNSIEDIDKYGNSNTRLKKLLHLKFGFDIQYCNMLANITFNNDYGSLSAKAIRKILPYLKEGNNYSTACFYANYNHSNSKSAEVLANRILKDKLSVIKKNSLRNPVVEKILNQMVNLVNEVINIYGKPDEIRIELARELKKSAKEREELSTINNSAKIQHENIKKLLQKEFKIKNPSQNDIIRYKLYEELSSNCYRTLYTNQEIKKEDLFSEFINIEHIIPKAKLYDDSFSNKTLDFRKSNTEKGSLTAYDYIDTKYKEDLDNYVQRVESLFKLKKISQSKRNKLLMKENEIPDGFIDRDLRNSQYIAKKAKEMLEEVVRTVNTTTGSITSKLREDWGLTNAMQDLNLPKFKAIDESLIIQVEKKDGSFKTHIKDWSKRNDHRHHAMDAITVAFTKHSIIQYYNYLNARKNSHHKFHQIVNNIENKETFLENNKRKFVIPMPNFRNEVKHHLENILISFKTKNKVVTNNKNVINAKNKLTKIELTPRGQLHKETIYGKITEQIIKEEKINASFTIEKIANITKPHYQKLLIQRLNEYNNDPAKAFTGKNALTKNPIYIDVSKNIILPELVKVKYLEDVYTIRKEINHELKIDKVIDKKIQTVLYNRLKAFNNNPKEAFSNLDKNPIWLNKEKNIEIKRVTISGVNNVASLHTKTDHNGKKILDNNNQEIPVDFVSTGNNHHVAIYKDEKGKLQEKVVSFYEAVERANQGLPIIDIALNKDLGWEFMFTLKQNEMFLFESDDFKPYEIDLFDEKNNAKISKNLFRVQKISSKNYMFVHHLETISISGDYLKKFKSLASHTYNFLWNTEPLKKVLKVRINHIGKIVQIGEY